MGRFRSWWRGLILGRKLAAAAVLALALFGAATVVGAAALCQMIDPGCGMVPLYAGMSADEATRVRAELERMGESYESTDDRIMVRADRRDVIRMEMATKNVAPKGGITGYELLDGINLTQTNADREIAKQRALQGELARAIKTMDGIADAKVLLAVPADSPATAPTASVLLTLQSGARLNQEQLWAVAQFIVHAVPRLTEHNVVIADNRRLKLYPLDNARPASNLAKERS